jgi:hypothetical protein
MTILQAPPAPPAPITIDGEEISRRINEALNQALSQSQAGQQQNARESIRDVIRDVQREVQAARVEARGGTLQPPFDAGNVIPPQAVDISIAFFLMIGFIIVGLPLARAFARRMDRRGEPAPIAEITPRLDRIEQAVEAIAIEVERVSEGQRYTTKAIADLRGLTSSTGAGGWPSGARDPERVPAGETSRRP